MPKFSRRELTRRVALTEADLSEIGQCRRPYNQLGFAYQLCFVRLLNRFPVQEPFELVDDLVLFVALQLGKDPELIDDYLGRQPTRSDHQQRISAYLGLRRFEARDRGVLEQQVFEAAMRLEQPSGLTRCVDEFLVEHKLLRPADSSLTRLIGQQRRRARDHIFSRISDLLPVATTEKLDALLVVPDGSSHSPIHTIKMNSGYPSASAMMAALEKLHTIENTGALALDLSWLNSNYQRALFHKVRKKSAHQLRQTSTPVRYAALVCFLRQSYGDTIDQAVLMFSKLLTRAEARASASLGETMRDEKSAIKDGLSALASMGSVVLGDAPEVGLRERIFEAVSREDLAESVQYAIEWSSGRKSDQRQMLVDRYRSLRKYGPAFLEAIGLEPEKHGEASPVLDAIKVLRGLNAAGKRKVPEGAPMDFLSTRWRRTVSRDGQISRPAWECALLLKTRDEIRGGNLAVRHSKRFGHLDDLFMPEARWAKVRQGFFSRAELPGCAADVPAYLSRRLHAAFERFEAAAQTNTYASVDGKGWKLSVDPAEKMSEEEEGRLDALKGWLDEHARRVRLPDLLIEVDNDLGFSRMFMPMSRRSNPSADEVCTIIAAVMAQGCNIGAHTMAQLTSGVTYERLKRVGDWQLTRDTQREALAVVVKAISDLDSSLHWGEGKTSASDGQRFRFRRKVLQKTYSPRFSDFALEFYTFVADNYAPFYSTPIDCSDRDAATVLDGLLYNESDLPLEAHYTDTHGYTEVNFAAFAMLGRRFSPRIRGIKKQRLYRVDNGDYGSLGCLVERSDRKINTRAIAEQWDRLGHF